MSRIMKRPMFRKGGSTGEGIMSKVEPRQGYATGKSVKEIYEEYRPLYEAAAKPARDDSISKFLIRGGMNLIDRSDKDTGLLQSLTGAYREPTEKLISDTERADAFARQGQLAALGSAIKTKQIQDMALAKQKKQTYAQNLPAYKYKDILEMYKGSLRSEDRQAARNLIDNRPVAEALIAQNIPFAPFKDQKDPQFQQLIKNLKTPLFFFGDDGQLKVATKGRIVPISLEQAISIHTGTAKKGD